MPAMMVLQLRCVDRVKPLALNGWEFGAVILSEAKNLIL
jgi:hypothetical protein